MADTTLITIPFVIALVCLAFALASGWVWLSAGPHAQRTAASKSLRCDAMIFSLGAFLLACFFLFNAGFFYFMR